MTVSVEKKEIEIEIFTNVYKKPKQVYNQQLWPNQNKWVQKKISKLR